jgi:hypothetical protein
MVVDLLIAKAVDAIASWYTKNKGRREEADKLLRELSRLLNKPLLHMNMSKKHGCFIMRTYIPFLEKDIENLDDFISLHAPEIMGDFATTVGDFRDYLVEFYTFMKGASLGCGDELDAYLAGIERYVKETTARINSILSDR